MTSDPLFQNGVLILAAAGGLYAFWMFCRKVVRWGFFTLYFLVGAGIALALNPKGPAMLPIVAGVFFAYSVLAIKSKIWRIVTPVVTLGALVTLAPLVLPKAEKPVRKSAPVSSPESRGGGKQAPPKRAPSPKRGA